MAAVEATAPPLERPQEDPKLVSMEDDDPKAALKKALLQDGENEDQILFSCNICYELASEPVVTLCGHLYCWPCLYRWLQVQNHCRTCPVCKAGVDRDKVIPIYGRGGNEDPRTKTKDLTELEVPSRPIGQRPAPVMRNAMLQTNAVNMTTGQQTLGLIPTLFGLQGNAQGQGAYAEPLTPEQQHQAFLSRLLLMLGSFVIMCCEFQYVPFEYYSFSNNSSMLGSPKTLTVVSP